MMEFALESYSRRGEVVRLGPQHCFTAPDGSPWIHIDRTHGSADVDIPISPELKAAIDAMPKTNLVFLTTAYGKPRSKFGLGADFALWAREAGLPDNCRLHGLKKGGMRWGAEAGMSTHELMALSGHKTLTEVQCYTRGADQKRLAGSGMAKRVTNSEPPTYKPRANLLEIQGSDYDLVVPVGVAPIAVTNWLISTLPQPVAWS